MNNKNNLEINQIPERKKNIIQSCFSRYFMLKYDITDGKVQYLL